MEVRKLINIDCLKGMAGLPPASINLIYTDPPYNMNSRYQIDSVTGHYYFKGKGQDFMNKWEAMDGKWWQKYFEEAYRILKYGGFVIMHNIDRQSDLWSYYARKAGFMPTQKLYWLFISNFPKATDVALMIDKKLKVERKKVGEDKQYISAGTGVYNWNNPEIALKQREVLTDMRGGKYMKDEERSSRPKLVRDITVATSELAIKYDGYKYGQACLKQILEEILVFWKEPKISVIDDIFALEKKHATDIHPSIFNIKDTRVKPSKNNKLERFTPQLLVDKRVAPFMRSHRGKSIDFNNLQEVMTVVEFNEEELKIPYASSEFDDLYYYEPKASKSEKEEGLDGFQVVENRKATEGLYTPEGKDKWATKSKNPHPTAKPLALCKWVLTLFKPPVPIVVLDTFAGQGSIPRACEEMNIDWIAFELNPEFYKVAEAKIKSAKLTLF